MFEAGYAPSMKDWQIKAALFVFALLLLAFVIYFFYPWEIR
jgi:hypothetical protein